MKEIHKILENGQYSLMCNEIIGLLLNEVPLLSEKNIIRKENAIQFKPTFSQTLTIQLTNLSTPSIPATPHLNESLNHSRNHLLPPKHENREEREEEWHFDMSLLYIILFKLLFLKFNWLFFKKHQKFYFLENFQNTSFAKEKEQSSSSNSSFLQPGSSSSNPSASSSDEFDILPFISGFFAHLNFRKSVHSLLCSLSHSFSSISYSSSFPFPIPRYFHIHWIPTFRPFISCVDLKIGDWYVILLSISSFSFFFHSFTISVRSSPSVSSHSLCYSFIFLIIFIFIFLFLFLF